MFSFISGGNNLDNSATKKLSMRLLKPRIDRTPKEGTHPSIHPNQAYSVERGDGPLLIPGAFHMRVQCGSVAQVVQKVVEI
jgi:hypothetical protein